PHRYHGGSSTARCIASHAPIVPRAGSHGPGQGSVKLQRNPARQTDLTPMGVAGDEHFEACVCSLPIDLRGVRDQNGEFVVRYRRGCLGDVVKTEEMCVVDSGDVDTLIAAFDRLALVE